MIVHTLSTPICISWRAFIDFDFSPLSPLLSTPVCSPSFPVPFSLLGRGLYVPSIVPHMQTSTKIAFKFIFLFSSQLPKGLPKAKCYVLILSVTLLSMFGKRFQSHLIWPYSHIYVHPLLLTAVDSAWVKDGDEHPEFVALVQVADRPSPLVFHKSEKGDRLTLGGISDFCSKYCIVLYCLSCCYSSNWWCKYRLKFSIANRQILALKILNQSPGWRQGLEKWKRKTDTEEAAYLKRGEESWRKWRERWPL